MASTSEQVCWAAKAGGRCDFEARTGSPCRSSHPSGTTIVRPPDIVEAGSKRDTEPQDRRISDSYRTSTASRRSCSRTDDYPTDRSSRRDDDSNYRGSRTNEDYSRNARELGTRDDYNLDRQRSSDNLGDGRSTESARIDRRPSHDGLNVERHRSYHDFDQNWSRRNSDGRYERRTAQDSSQDLRSLINRDPGRSLSRSSVSSGRRDSPLSDSRKSPSVNEEDLRYLLDQRQSRPSDRRESQSDTRYTLTDSRLDGRLYNHNDDGERRRARSSEAVISSGKYGLVDKGNESLESRQRTPSNENGRTWSEPTKRPSHADTRPDSTTRRTPPVSSSRSTSDQRVSIRKSLGANSPAPGDRRNNMAPDDHVTAPTSASKYSSTSRRADSSPPRRTIHTVNDERTTVTNETSTPSETSIKRDRSPSRSISDNNILAPMQASVDERVASQPNDMQQLVTNSASSSSLTPSSSSDIKNSSADMKNSSSRRSAINPNCKRFAETQSCPTSDACPYFHKGVDCLAYYQRGACPNGSRCAMRHRADASMERLTALLQSGNIQRSAQDNASAAANSHIDSASTVVLQTADARASVQKHEQPTNVTNEEGLATPKSATDIDVSRKRSASEVVASSDAPNNEERSTKRACATNKESETALKQPHGTATTPIQSSASQLTIFLVEEEDPEFTWESVDADAERAKTVESLYSQMAVAEEEALASLRLVTKKPSRRTPDSQLASERILAQVPLTYALLDPQVAEDVKVAISPYSKPTRGENSLTPLSERKLRNDAKLPMVIRRLEPLVSINLYRESVDMFLSHTNR